MKKLTYLALSSLLLMSCHQHIVNLKSNDDQYLYSKSAPVLVIPAGSSREKLGNDYPVPTGSYPTDRHSVSQLPPNSFAAVRG